MWGMQIFLGLVFSEVQGITLASLPLLTCVPSSIGQKGLVC